MTMTRVQFQPGLSMTEFMDRYGSDEKCAAALIQARWPGGFGCPECGGGRHSTFRREGRLYFRCRACLHQSSIISGTNFAASKLALSRWFQAMHRLTQSTNLKFRAPAVAKDEGRLPGPLARQARRLDREVTESP
jgi:hypothetical protein